MLLRNSVMGGRSFWEEMAHIKCFVKKCSYFADLLGSLYSFELLHKTATIQWASFFLLELGEWCKVFVRKYWYFVAILGAQYLFEILNIWHTVKKVGSFKWYSKNVIKVNF